MLAGFSAGGQLVQRYAAVGKGSDIDLRYVVGRPSSFLYFGAARPEATTGCADFNRWKYGLDGDLPPYVAAAMAGGEPALERRAARAIICEVWRQLGDQSKPSFPRPILRREQGPAGSSA